GSQSFTITADPSYTVTDVWVDGTDLGAITSYTFNNVTDNHTILAVFDSNSDLYTITASAGAGGSFSPSGAVTVSPGESQTFAILPNSGYQIADVQVDGADQGVITTYTFDNVSS